jgi:hypothetical protein
MGNDITVFFIGATVYSKERLTTPEGRKQLIKDCKQDKKTNESYVKRFEGIIEDLESLGEGTLTIKQVREHFKIKPTDPLQDIVFLYSIDKVYGLLPFLTSVSNYTSLKGRKIYIGDMRKEIETATEAINYYTRWIGALEKMSNKTYAVKQAFALLDKTLFESSAHGPTITTKLNV